MKDWISHISSFNSFTISPTSKLYKDYTTMQHTQVCFFWPAYSYCYCFLFLSLFPGHSFLRKWMYMIPLHSNKGTHTQARMKQ